MSLGTHLELVDDDDDYVNVYESPAGDHSNITQDQPPTDGTQLDNIDPTRLQDYVRS